jgi:hypothetical protein
MIRFPATLPMPLAEPYAVKPADGVVRTDMEQGPARQRREFTQVPTKIPVKWRFTDAQYAVFDAWYQWKGKAGAEWFIIPLRSGLGVIDHVARFTRQYEAPLSSGGFWLVTVELEVRDRPVLSEAELDILLDSSWSDLSSAVTGLDTVASIQWPDSFGA